VDTCRSLLPNGKKTLRNALTALVVAVAASGLTSTVEAAGTFSFRKAITINQSGGRGNQPDFPFLVSISGDADLTANVQSANGYDIAFTDGVNPLDFEIEYFDRPSGTLLAWVRIPLLQPGVNMVYLNYGDSTIGAPIETGCAAWDSDHVGVWHLGETGNGTVDEYRDSSLYGNHGQGGEGDPLFVPTRVTGPLGFGYGQHFDNSDTKYDLIDCGDDATLDITGNQITLEAWIQHNISAPSAGNHGFLNHKGFENGYRLLFPNQAAVPPAMEFQLPGRTHTLQTANGISAGTWHHIAATYDGATMRVYVDGVNDPADQLAKSSNILPSLAEQDFWIGHADQPQEKVWSWEWDGDIDEVRISRVARSADWIATNYDNQRFSCFPATAFCSLGAQTAGPFAVSTLAVNYRSIGTAAGNLAPPGTATSTASSTTVTFSASLGANIGAGDELILEPGGTPETLFILSRDAATQVTVQTPATLSRTVSYTITRAYNTLADWEKDISVGGRGGPLVAENRREIGVAYDDGDLTTGVVIDGSTTDCVRNMKLTAASGQRHYGVAATGADTKVVLDNGSNITPAIQIGDEFVTVEWLEIKGGSGVAADGIEIANTIASSNLAVLQYNLIHDTGGDGLRVSDPDGNVDVFNNVIYEANNGIHLTVDMSTDARVNVFNNTIYSSNAAGGSPSGVATDLLQTSVRVDLRNNIAHSNANGDFGLVAPFDRAYFCNPGCTQLANGGVVPDPNEYLADTGNTFTFNFTVATDYLYLGSASMFRGLSVVLATNGTGNPDLQWDYWNGAGWVSLETGPFSDGTNQLKRSSGVVYWADDPAGWSTTSVNGSPSLYYVRVSLASGSYSTFPMESLITRADINTASRNNLASDPSASPHSPWAAGTTGLDTVALPSMNFKSTTAGSEDLHITSGSAAEDAAADLTTFLSGDIDAGLRTAPWEVGADDVDATTAVELVSFEAVGVDGAVELTWETGSELENLGFHLYRSLSEEGPYEQITASVIPGLGSSPAGANYSYVDSGLTNGVTYYYKLEDIETTGTTELHGPVSATPQAGAPAGDNQAGEEGSGENIRVPTR
jgi:hypothetical protein